LASPHERKPSHQADSDTIISFTLAVEGIRLDLSTNHTVPRMAHAKIALAIRMSVTFLAGDPANFTLG